MNQLMQLAGLTGPEPGFIPRNPALQQAAPQVMPQSLSFGDQMGNALTNPLVQLGMGIMAAGGQPGATFLGALGQGGLSASNSVSRSRRAQQEREDRLRRERAEQDRFDTRMERDTENRREDREWRREDRENEQEWRSDERKARERADDRRAQADRDFRERENKARRALDEQIANLRVEIDANKRNGIDNRLSRAAKIEELASDQAQREALATGAAEYDNLSGKLVITDGAAYQRIFDSVKTRIMDGLDQSPAQPPQQAPNKSIVPNIGGQFDPSGVPAPPPGFVIG